MNEMTVPARAGSRFPLTALHNRAAAVADSFSQSYLALLARFGIAGVFFLSGRTKVDGLLSVNDSAIFLFAEEYRVPFLAPDVAAHIAAYAEHLFPLLLVLGLFTRISAAALLTMTLVIQVFVYPDAWVTHLSWAAILVYLLARGAGAISLDRIIGLK